jgi:hypothetical protein
MPNRTAPMSGPLVQRLAVLQAHNDIRELAARYGAAYARLDVAGLVALYPPDVELLSGDIGRDALYRHFERGIQGAHDGDGLNIVILHVGNHVIDLDSADTAYGTVYCHGEMQRRNGDWYHQAIIYSDDYVRVDNQWHFARQRNHELVYGVPPQTRPIDLPPANWPQSQVGQGTLPARWPSWPEFWAPDKKR